MIRYFVNKLFYAFITLLGVVTVIFFLFTILPGDPAKMMLGQNQSAEQVEAVKKSMVLINQSVRSFCII